MKHFRITTRSKRKLKKKLKDFLKLLQIKKQTNEIFETQQKLY